MLRRLLISFMLCCLTLPTAGLAGEADTMTLLAINVGKADCLILRSGHTTYMIDTGTVQSWGAVSAALRLNGITSLDGVIVTHTDKDHAGGVWALATSGIPVGAWYASAFFCEVTEDKHPVVLAAAVRGETVRWLKSGDTLPLDGGTLTVLGPTVLFDDKENNNSLVLYAEAAGGSMLLAGDMEEPEEQLLLAAGLITHADVLKVGHHGEGDATSARLLDVVRPRVAVISTNSVEEPDTPSNRVMRTLKAVGAQIALTENAPGGVLATVSGGEVSARLLTWPAPPEAVTGVAITAKDAQADTVTLKNEGSAAVDLSGWYLYSEKGKEIMVLPDGTALAPGETLTVGTLTTQAGADLIWPERNVWHNTKPDAAILYDAYGREISRAE